ncbi:DUF4145 domain-containing protein [Pontibacter russatus]|uniref:DUF4145 domain-containing protein n=1 Tax=Pontibacter russatus TaxID=2694929 RepID=UPI00137974C5|nr:DUF4145 domain-containing protein [Pontibacter russatus]
MISKDILLNNFSKIEYLTFVCECCKKGAKVFDTNKYFESESEFSRREYTEDVNGFKTKIQRRFSAGFICSNSECRDISILVGEINSILRLQEENYQGQVTQNPTYNNRISIFDIVPTLNLFDIESYSFKTEASAIESELKDVFSVFWRNADCCAMKIRAFLEVLMDDNIIGKTGTDKKGKEYPYKLHRRIEFFEEKYPNEDLKAILLNLKDFGNIGSHAGEKLTREKLIIMVEIVECILNQLYTDNRGKLIILDNKLKKSATNV